VRSITSRLRQAVVERAHNRCEYCGLFQEGQEATFHIDHVVPIAAGGQTVLENLALACVSCSLRKGAREVALDPITNKEVPIFSPRQDPWEKHFRWSGVEVMGLTATGRATVEALRMNRLLAVEIRRAVGIPQHPS